MSPNRVAVIGGFFRRGAEVLIAPGDRRARHWDLLLLMPSPSLTTAGQEIESLSDCASWVLMGGGLRTRRVADVAADALVSTYGLIRVFPTVPPDMTVGYLAGWGCVGTDPRGFLLGL